MLENRDYCDYDTCVTLKELGFNALVDWYFNEDKRIVSSLATYRDTYIPRISLYEAQKWLREEKQVEVIVLSRGMIGAPYYFQVYTEDYVIADDKDYASFEEALSEGIKETVEILKEE